MVNEPPDRRGIQSVEIGMRVIDALRVAPSGMPLKALAEAARLPTSNCHRYLVSFVRCGFVVQDPASGRYDLGPKLLQAGLAALARVDAVTIATEALRDVVEESGYTGQLAVWTDKGPVVIRWMVGRVAVRTSISVGALLPTLGTATGLAFLSFLPNRETSNFLRDEPNIDRAAIAEIVADVRAQGYATVSGSHIPGLSAVACPVLDSSGEAAITMTLVGLADGISTSAVGQLTDAAERASFRLGAPPRSAHGSL